MNTDAWLIGDCNTVATTVSSSAAVGDNQMMFSVATSHAKIVLDHASDRFQMRFFARNQPAHIAKAFPNKRRIVHIGARFTKATVYRYFAVWVQARNPPFHGFNKFAHH
jgi:hypothetical protein